MGKPHNFRAIADDLEREIADGRLRIGERLPPQREFAFARGMSPSTATRVYGELVRRRLVAGEVGRGSFVLGRRPGEPSAMLEPSSAAVDLEMVAPTLSSQRVILAKTLAGFAASTDFEAAVRPVSNLGNGTAREGAAALLRTPDWKPDPATVIFAGSGKQALSGALDALLRPGERLGVEALTYPFVVSQAARRGIEIVPLRLDGEGLRPDAIVAAHAHKPLRAVYFQPAMQNPTAATMSATRRRAIADALRTIGAVGIEDAVYSFLDDGSAPVAAHLPDSIVLVDSLTKRVTPGFSLGVVVSPPSLLPDLSRSIRAGGLIPSGLSLAVGGYLMLDGTARRLGEAKRRDARARQAIARDILPGDLKGDPSAYHLWLPLSRGRRGEAFAADALRLGIAVVPGRSFAAGGGRAPNHVRLALAAPPRRDLKTALARLAALIGEG